jgi:hypothetical protein
MLGEWLLHVVNYLTGIWVGHNFPIEILLLVSLALLPHPFPRFAIDFFAESLLN